VPAASVGCAAGIAEFENRLAMLKGDKKAIKGNIRVHRQEKAKVEETYQKL
jgi:hypothetical protein